MSCSWRRAPRRFAALKDLKKADAKAFEKVWKSIRKDGAYVEAGENDNVIVQKLEANKNAFGIFGYSFLEENTAKLKGVAIDGVEPDLRRDLVGQVQGRRVRCSSTSRSSTSASSPASTSSSPSTSPTRPWRRTAILPRKGLVALPKDEAAKVAEAAKAMKALTPDLVN